MNGYRTIPHSQTGVKSRRRKSAAEILLYRVLTVLCHPAVKAIVLAALLVIAIGIAGSLEAGTISFKTGIFSVIAIAAGVAVL